MPDERTEAVFAIGYELVLRLAPDELPLYQSQAGQAVSTNIGGAKGRLGRSSPDDRLLGFGSGEAVALLTPMILEFARSFWDALAAQAADSSLRGLLERRRRAREQGGEDLVPLTPDQLQLVRKVAAQQALLLHASDGQASLLADAVIGALTAPGTS